MGLGVPEVVQQSLFEYSPVGDACVRVEFTDFDFGEQDLMELRWEQLNEYFSHGDSGFEVCQFADFAAVGVLKISADPCQSSAGLGAHPVAVLNE